jgi:hypothetical protein
MGSPLWKRAPGLGSSTDDEPGMIFRAMSSMPTSKSPPARGASQVWLGA